MAAIGTHLEHGTDMNVHIRKRSWGLCPLDDSALGPETLESVRMPGM
jgi:hypothetical protein